MFSVANEKVFSQPMYETSSSSFLFVWNGHLVAIDTNTMQIENRTNIWQTCYQLGDYCLHEASTTAVIDQKRESDIDNNKQQYSRALKKEHSIRVQSHETEGRIGVRTTQDTTLYVVTNALSAQLASTTLSDTRTYDILSGYILMIYSHHFTNSLIPRNFQETDILLRIFFLHSHWLAALHTCF